MVSTRVMDVRTLVMFLRRISLRIAIEQTQLKFCPDLSQFNAWRNP